MRVIGMISGTSADAIEVVLCQIDGEPPRLGLTVEAAVTVPFPRELQARVHAAATVAGSDVEAICLLDAELGETFAAAALRLIEDTQLRPGDVDLIGSHGQTIWHAVRDDGSVASTLQIGGGAFVAERTGITTWMTCARATSRPAVRVHPSWPTWTGCSCDTRRDRARCRTWAASATWPTCPR